MGDSYGRGTPVGVWVSGVGEPVPDEGWNSAEEGLEERTVFREHQDPLLHQHRRPEHDRVVAEHGQQIRHLLNNKSSP